MLKEDWEAILDQYELSDKRQKVFCSEQNISHKAFVYRWNRRIRLKKHRASLFEPVSINSVKDSGSSCLLRIRFPNKIRCEVQVKLDEVKTWIKELSDVASV